MKTYEKNLKLCQRDILKHEREIQNNLKIYNEQRELFLNQQSMLSYTQVELRLSTLNALIADKKHHIKMVELLKDRVEILQALIEGR